LLFGKNLKKESQNGIQNGVKDVLVGILNAQPWLHKFMEEILIFIWEELILGSLIMIMNLLNLKLTTTVMGIING